MDGPELDTWVWVCLERVRVQTRDAERQAERREDEGNGGRLDGRAGERPRQKKWAAQAAQATGLDSTVFGRQKPGKPDGPPRQKQNSKGVSRQTASSQRQKTGVSAGDGRATAVGRMPRLSPSTVQYEGSPNLIQDRGEDKQEATHNRLEIVSGLHVHTAQDKFKINRANGLRGEAEWAQFHANENRKFDFSATPGFVWHS